MGTKSRTILTAVLLVCLAERGRSDEASIPSHERFNFFDFELLQNVAKTSNGNVLVSPASVKSTLAMLLEAAHGVSADEIQTALRIPANSNVQSFVKAYLDTFRERGSGYLLELANRLFMSDSLNVNPRYASALREYYHADVDTVNFGQPDKAARNINHWVRNVTRGLIPELVAPGSLNPSAQALVANAIYFKGLWKTQFQSSRTRSLCFYARPGSCMKTDMMNELAEYRYGYIPKLDALAIELPYKGEKFSMVILLPTSQSGIDQLVHDIDHAHMREIIGQMETTEVMLSIPRFSFEFNIDLVQTLRDLNIRDIFSLSSNLTGMFTGTETTAMISNVFHKTKIIVNEEGSEAAAATGAQVVPLMGSTIPTFRADHPFLFFIRSTTNNAILFAGRVSEPDATRTRPTQEQELESIYPQPTPSRRRPTTTEGKRSRSANAK